MDIAKFELVGGLAGQTINLGGHAFQEGIFEFGPNEQGIFPGPDEVKLKAIYLAKCYQAYLVGSDELATAKKRLASDENDPELLSVPAREEAEQAERDAPKIHVAEQPEQPVTEQPVTEQPKPAPASDRARNGAVRTGLTKLDPKNDAHWTDAGLPSVNAVRELSGQSDIGRAEITALAPKLTREEAAKIAANPLDD